MDLHFRPGNDRRFRPRPAGDRPSRRATTRKATSARCTRPCGRCRRGAGYAYEHLFIDNCSKDGTPAALKELAAADPRGKVIFNARNFGHIRSPIHGILQADGDAVIGMAADFQDPPALIPQFLRHWEAGSKVVLGVKESADEAGADVRRPPRCTTSSSRGWRTSSCRGT